MLGKTLSGRYQIVKHLGGGGFGQTYLAEDSQLPGNPLCVVKQLQPQSNDPDTLQIARRLFDREAQVLYRLGHHDQIPRLLAHFEEEEEFYLVQEFIDGHELKNELPVGKQWSQTQVIILLQDVLKILEFVHQHDVIHRDIKPANLIRRKQDGKIVLIDFGAVKQVSIKTAHPHGQTTLSVAIGSPGYMPNEQLGGKPRFCSDIYAVGMLGIQALTGLAPRQLPEDPTTEEIIWRDRVPVGAIHELPLLDVLDKMVRFDYRQRYQTATEALQALQLLNTDLSPHQETTRTYAVTPPPVLTQPPATPTLPPKTAPSQQQTTHDSPTQSRTVEAELPPETAPSQQQTTHDSLTESWAPEAELPPETAPSGQQTTATPANPSVSGLSSRDDKAGVATSPNKSRRLMGIGTSIVTALALTAGIYFFQKPSGPWDVSEKIALAYTFPEQGAFDSVAISPDGKMLASRNSNSNDHTIKLWNLTNNELLHTLSDAPGNPRNSIAFSPDGQMLASAARDNTIKLWNPNTGQPLPPLTGHSDWVDSVAFSPDRQTLASGSRDETIKLWNLGTRQLVRTIKADLDVNSVAFSPDGQTLASGSYRAIKLWNVQTGQLKSTIFDAEGRGGELVAFSPDGKTLVSSLSSKISLWDLGNLPNSCEGIQPCRPKHTLSHSDTIESFAISRDGQTLASASIDRTIKLWNMQTGEHRSTIPDRFGAVDAVTFSPDGKTLVSSSAGKIKVWRSH